jgi:FkbM family methyltransferase
VCEVVFDRIKEYVQLALQNFGLRIEKLEYVQDPFIDMQILLESNTVKRIIDGGAYHGVISKKLLSTFPRAMVYAFEPQSDIFKILQKNVKDLPNIKPINKALSSSPGKRELFINKKRDTSSLSPISNSGKDFIPHVQPLNTQIVDVITLDDWSKKSNAINIDIVKLDLQGHELDALKGCTNLINSSVKIIYTEVEFVKLYENNCLFFEIETFLRKHNFNLFQFYHLKSSKDGRLLWGDALFIKKDLLNKK